LSRENRRLHILEVLYALFPEWGPRAILESKLCGYITQTELEFELRYMNEKGLVELRNDAVGEWAEAKLTPLGVDEFEMKKLRGAL
jgi:uncharacterized protein YgfB (UPF0149 family)